MSSFRYDGHVIAEGSVSTGTLRTEDLLSSFRSEIARYVAAPTRQVSAYFEAKCWLEGREEYQSDGFIEPQATEAEFEECGQRLVGELEKYLNGMAPEGWYFGACEGDGADIGWWRENEDVDLPSGYSEIV